MLSWNKKLSFLQFNNSQSDQDSSLNNRNLWLSLWKLHVIETYFNSRFCNINWTQRFWRLQLTHRNRNSSFNHCNWRMDFQKLHFFSKCKVAANNNKNRWICISWLLLIERNPNSFLIDGYRPMGFSSWDEYYKNIINLFL